MRFLIILFAYFHISMCLKDPTDIIISDNETVILDLDGYYINGNMNYSIKNENFYHFNISLTETFYPSKTLNFNESTFTKSIKLLKNHNIFVLLQQDRLKFVLGDEFKLLEAEFLSISAYLPEKIAKFGNLLCYDIEEFPDNHKNFTSFFILDCDLIDLKNVIIKEILLFFELKIEKTSDISLKLLFYTITSSFIDIFSNYTEKLAISTRKIKVNKGELFRYTPASLKVFEEDVGNNLEIYDIDMSDKIFSLLIILYQNSLESIDFYLEHLILMTLTNSLILLNGTECIYSTADEIFINDDLNNFRFPLTNIDISINTLEIDNNRVILLTDRICFYFKILLNTMKFSYNYQLPLDIDPKGPQGGPNSMLPLRDYMLIRYIDHIKVIYIRENLDPEDPMDLIQFNYNLRGISMNYNFFISCGNNCFINDYFMIFSLSNGNPKRNSSAVMTQIRKRKLVITSFNTSEKNMFYSMKRFNFTLTMEPFEDMLFTLIYWRFDDKNLYFYTRTKPYSPNLNRSLYITDTNEIFIENRDFLLGPLKEVSISKTKPYSSAFTVDKSSSYILDFSKTVGFKDIFIKDDFFKEISFFVIAVTPKSIRVLFQREIDTVLYMTTCLWQKTQILKECMLTNLGVMNNSIRNSIRYKAYLIVQITGRNELFYSLPKLREITSISIKQLYSVICKEFYIDDAKDWLFCQNIDYLYIYQICENSESNTLTLTKFPGFFTLDNEILRIYIDMLVFNCILVEIENTLIFVEIRANERILHGESICISSDINLNIFFEIRSNLPLKPHHNVYIFSKTTYTYGLLIIYPPLNIIAEYSLLESPFEAKFLRNYPTYDFYINEDIFLNNRIFICIRAKNMHNESYLLIYNVTEPTSNLLKKALKYDEGIAYINVYCVSNNIYEELNFLETFNEASMKYPVILEKNEKNQLFLKIYKKYNLLGDLTQELVNSDFTAHKSHLIYNISLKYNNTFISHFIMWQIEIKLILKDIVILSQQPTRPLKNYEITRKSFVFNISNEYFKGPIEKYKLDYSNTSESKISVKTKGFLYNGREFIGKNNDSYGNYIQSIEINGSLFQLTEKKLLIINIFSNDSFEIVQEYIIPKEIEKCEEMNIFPSFLTIFLYCKKSQKLSLLILLYENIEKAIKLVKMKEFSEYFDFFISVLESPPKTLIFLAEDSSYNSYFQKKALFFFTLPTPYNDFAAHYLGKICDEHVKDSLFMRNLKDFQLILNNQWSNTYNYLCFLVISGSMMDYWVVLIYGSYGSLLDVDLIQRRSIDILKPIEDMQYMYYKEEFRFFNARILACIVENNENRLKFNANITVLINSNLHTFLYQINIDSGLVGVSRSEVLLLKVFRKFYSCQNAMQTRPKIFKNYLGTFCERKIDSDEFSTKSYSYFLLYKINGFNELESYPVLALPIYSESYNVVFFEKKEKDLLIIPCFLCLFTIYTLNENIRIEVSDIDDINNFQGNFVVTAFNGLTENTIDIEIFRKNEKTEVFPLIFVICIGITYFMMILGIILLILWGVKRYKRWNKRKKERNCKDIRLIDKNLMVVFKKKKKKNLKLIQNSYSTNITVSRDEIIQGYF